MTRSALSWFFCGAALAALIYSAISGRPIYVIVAVALSIVSIILSPLGPAVHNDE